MKQIDVIRQARHAAKHLLAALENHTAIETDSFEKWNEGLCRYVLYHSSSLEASLDLMNKMRSILLFVRQGKVTEAENILRAYVVEVHKATEHLMSDFNKEIDYELPIGTVYPPTP